MAGPLSGPWEADPAPIERGPAVVAIIGICLAAPITLICAVVTELTVQRPILFRQRRGGQTVMSCPMGAFHGRDPAAKVVSAGHLNAAGG